MDIKTEKFIREIVSDMAWGECSFQFCEGPTNEKTGLVRRKIVPMGTCHRCATIIKINNKLVRETGKPIDPKTV